jgi:hypothetical protein
MMNDPSITPLPIIPVIDFGQMLSSQSIDQKSYQWQEWN